jgi:hypothetical protein
MTDSQVTPERFHDAGDTVVTESRYSGVYKATGKSINAQACHVWKIRDGKVTSFQQYLDHRADAGRHGNTRRGAHGRGKPRLSDSGVERDLGAAPASLTSLTTSGIERPYQRC